MAPPSIRQSLGQRLRQARTAAALTSVDLARALGISQGQLSRIENGQRRASGEIVRAWLEHTGEQADVIDELVAQVDFADREIADWKKRFRQGWDADQRSYEDVERAAAAICSYQISVVPGLLQSPAYTEFLLRHVIHLSDDEVERGVAARSRRQRLLYEPGTKLTVVIAEHVLRHRGIGGPTIMVEQLHRIGQLATLPTVDLAIIPTDTSMPLPYMVSFDLYDAPDDDALVTIEFDTGEIRESQPHCIEQYRRRFTALRSAALTDSDALDLLQRITTEMTAEAFAQ